MNKCKSDLDDGKYREGVLDYGNIYFPFNGYGDWEDYLLMLEAVESKIKPDKELSGGLTDMSGYFIKNGQRLDIEFDGMIGNAFVLKKEYQKKCDIELVRQWVKEVLNYCLEHRAPHERH